MKLCKAIVQSNDIVRSSATTENVWDQHDDILDFIEQELLPSGSGFDSGTKINREKTTDTRIVLDTAVHPLTDAGYYTAWKHFSIIVSASHLFGFTVKSSKKLPWYIREWVLDTFYEVLDTEVEYYVEDGTVKLRRAPS